MSKKATKGKANSSNKKEKTLLTKQESLKIDKLKCLYSELIDVIEEDPSRQGLESTPIRAAKAISFLTSGYKMDVESIVKSALYACTNNEMVIVKDIQLFSICEHHLLPFIGKCHVGYIPNGKVIGLSKIARVVDIYARRLQIQEHLTKQIAESLMQSIQAQGVIVLIEAMHLCMMMRGVLKNSATTQTISSSGIFTSNAKIRQEFMHSIYRQKQAEKNIDLT